MSRAKRSNFILIPLVLVFVASSVVIWLNRQNIQDWLTVRDYTPTAAVERIAKRINLTPKGNFLFYASEPEVNDSTQFNERCLRREPTAAVLGCYRDKHIFVYQVKTKELDGIQEVTAAHEMLHAAWDRMSERQRRHVESMIEAAYLKVKTPELENRMAYYDRQQPGERTNELHSILGTEFPELGDELEEYYKTYFNSRKQIVDLHSGYQSVFTALEEQAATLRSELEQMSAALNRDIAAHNKGIDKLNHDIESHNQALESIDRTDSNAVLEYNQHRESIQQDQVRLEEVYSRLEQRRKEYDAKLNRYNEIVVHTSTLTESIDSLKTSTELGR